MASTVLISIDYNSNIPNILSVSINTVDDRFRKREISHSSYSSGSSYLESEPTTPGYKFYYKGYRGGSATATMGG